MKSTRVTVHLAAVLIFGTLRCEAAEPIAKGGAVISGTSTSVDKSNSAASAPTRGETTEALGFDITKYTSIDTLSASVTNVFSVWASIRDIARRKPKHSGAKFDEFGMVMFYPPIKSGLDSFDAGDAKRIWATYVATEQQKAKPVTGGVKVRGKMLFALRSSYDEATKSFSVVEWPAQGMLPAPMLTMVLPYPDSILTDLSAIDGNAAAFLGPFGKPYSILSDSFVDAPLSINGRVSKIRVLTVVEGNRAFVSRLNLSREDARAFYRRNKGELDSSNLIAELEVCGEITSTMGTDSEIYPVLDCHYFIWRDRKTGALLDVIAASSRTSESSTAKSDLPALPTASGAYVLSEGSWKALPMNGSSVSQDVETAAAGLLKGIFRQASQPSGTGAGSAQSGDKLATLKFTGTIPVPSVGSSGFVAVFVGKPVVFSDELLAKFPELLNEPPIEMARLVTRNNGTRTADLYRIVPGVAGLGKDRLPADIQRISDDVVILRQNAALAPGRYVVSASAQGYEVEIK